MKKETDYIELYTDYLIDFLHNLKDDKISVTTQPHKI